MTETAPETAPYRWRVQIVLGGRLGGNVFLSQFPFATEAEAQRVYRSVRLNMVRRDTRANKVANHIEIKSLLGRETIALQEVVAVEMVDDEAWANLHARNISIGLAKPLSADAAQ